MRRYIYIACAILVALILVEALRLVSNRMSQDNKFKQFIDKNRIILVLLVSIILSVLSFAFFELKGASPKLQYSPATIENGGIQEGTFKPKNLEID